MSGPYYPSTLYAGWGAWDGQGILLSTPTTNGALPVASKANPSQPYFSTLNAQVSVPAGNIVSLGAYDSPCFGYYSTSALFADVAQVSTLSQPSGAVLPLGVNANLTASYFG